MWTSRKDRSRRVGDGKCRGLEGRPEESPEDHCLGTGECRVVIRSDPVVRELYENNSGSFE